MNYSSKDELLGEYLKHSPDTFIEILQYDIRECVGPIYYEALFLDEVLDDETMNKEHARQSIQHILARVQGLMNLTDVASEYDKMQKQKRQNARDNHQNQQ